MGTIDLIKKIPVKYWIIGIGVSSIFFAPLWLWSQYLLENNTFPVGASIIIPAAVIIGFVVSAFMTAGGLYYKGGKGIKNDQI